VGIFTQNAENAGAGYPIGAGIGFTPKQQDRDLKTAATDSEEQKEITGIARRGI
jgi:hypothetical protein